MWCGTLYLAVKIWYLAICMNKSRILSVAMLILQPNIMNSFVKVKLSQRVKLVCIQLCTCSKKLRVLGQSQNMCSKVSSAWLQKEHLGEFTIFLKNRKWTVGRSLYNNLYWHHHRHDSYVVLKIWPNTSLTSTSV